MAAPAKRERHAPALYVAGPAPPPTHVRAAPTDAEPSLKRARKQKRQLSAQDAAFWHLWPLCEKAGWRLQYGVASSGKRPIYLMPPGAKRAPGFRCRVDYFDSVRLALRALESSSDSHLRDIWRQMSDLESIIAADRRREEAGVGDRATKAKDAQLLRVKEHATRVGADFQVDHLPPYVGPWKEGAACGDHGADRSTLIWSPEALTATPGAQQGFDDMLRSLRVPVPAQSPPSDATPPAAESAGQPLLLYRAQAAPLEVVLAAVQEAGHDYERCAEALAKPHPQVPPIETPPKSLAWMECAGAVDGALGHKRASLTSSGWPADRAAAFMEGLFKYRRNLRHAAAHVEAKGLGPCSLADAMAFYYGCVKATPEYATLNAELKRQAEIQRVCAWRAPGRVWAKGMTCTAALLQLTSEHNDDDCFACHRGGNLLCCDRCSRVRARDARGRWPVRGAAHARAVCRPQAFHLECLQPPLSNVPEGSWACPVCLHGDAPG